MGDKEICSFSSDDSVVVVVDDCGEEFGVFIASEQDLYED